MQCKKIAIEGSDGAGKATITELLKKYLLSKDKNVESVSFPRYHETTGGKLCREVLKSERKEDYNFIDLSPDIASLLYIIDRVESKPYLEKIISENDVLIFDRYVESNFIHQGGKIKEDKERQKLINLLSNLEYDIYGLPKPDITFFLYLPTEIARKNKEKQRLQDQNIKMDAGEDDFNYLENSNKSGIWCSERFPWWNLIDCVDHSNGEQRSPEDILSEIIKKLDL